MRKKMPRKVLHQVTVENYAAEGKCIARVDGKAVFIEGVVPGDVVDVQLGKSKKDWAEGRPIHFHEMSKDRVEPFCSHFGICGGCQWQTLPYSQQLKYKHQQVMDNLTRIGKVQLPAISTIVGADKDRYYRNKIEYTFSNKRYLTLAELNNPDVSALSNVAGYHAKGVFDKVVDVDTCYLQGEPTNAIRKFVKEFGIKNNYSFYDVKLHQGFLRTMQLRICTTGEVMVNVVLGYEDAAKRLALLEAMQAAFPEITTLLYTINTKFNDSMFDLEPQVFFGKGYAIEKLEDFSFKIGPKSFFQTNTRQGEKLYQVTRDFAELKDSDTLYDLYCGTGSIGIFCSRQAKKIIGVEMIEAAIEDAKENAAMNDVQHAQFFAGDVIKVCDDAFFARHGRADVIITDPPRAGMHEQLVNKILQMQAPRVVYVSCNPATQARDLNLLDANYSVEKIQPVDMFPHTHHIENVVQLKLRS
jgi:23S rRNA (uracil1939-C5)-methyltransferase